MIAEQQIENMQAEGNKIIIGLGETGYSCAKYFYQRGEKFSVMDSRMDPPFLQQLQQSCPDIDIQLGSFDANILMQASELIVSPGVSINDPAIVEAQQNGVKVLGDIDLFSQEVSEPIIAITGSNGKSTVTSLVGAMISDFGIKVGVGGNIGMPVLDLLNHQNEMYVLELSSFQLETTHELSAEIATVLNVSHDHMDRYADLSSYHRAKQRIFQSAHQVVINDDDLLSQPLLPKEVKQWHFSLTESRESCFSLVTEKNERYLAFGYEKLMPINELKIIGLHNIANALAALAIGYAIGLSLSSMLSTLRQFTGLLHRCQWVANKHGVDYINDSKATNVGAAVAAINSFGSAVTKKNIILIAGGDAKDASMVELVELVSRLVKSTIVIGKDAKKLTDLLQPVTKVLHANTMTDAVKKASSIATQGDMVLLSPACSSLDMYENYMRRGEDFINAVKCV